MKFLLKLFLFYLIFTSAFQKKFRKTKFLGAKKSKDDSTPQLGQLNAHQRKDEPIQEGQTEQLKNMQQGKIINFKLK